MEINAVQAQIAVAEALAAQERPSVEQLEAAGYAAHAEGRPAAPGADAVVRKAIGDAPVGDPATAEAMRAFSRGRDRRVNEELALSLGVDDASRGLPSSPTSNPGMAEAIATSSAADGAALSREYALGHKARRTEQTLVAYRDQQASAAENLARTRGPRSRREVSPERVHAAFTEALASTSDAASAWDSVSLVQVRREYGPGSHSSQTPPTVPRPESESDRRLTMVENQMFYFGEQYPTVAASSTFSSQLAAIRREMTSRGLGPKVL